MSPRHEEFLGLLLLVTVTAVSLAWAWIRLRAAERKKLLDAYRNVVELDPRRERPRLRHVHLDKGERHG